VVDYCREVLSTLLIHIPWMAFSVLVGILAVAPFVGAWLVKKPRLVRALLVAAALVVAALTLYPDGDPSPGRTCAVQLPYLAPTAVESTANILLFVPVAFLFGIAWRRPVAAALLTVATSAVIETVQALVLVIGRACDTSDLITNSIGAILGGLCAYGAILRRRRLDDRTLIAVGVERRHRSLRGR
jgi:VanZ family protein